MPTPPARTVRHPANTASTWCRRSRGRPSAASPWTSPRTRAAPLDYTTSVPYEVTARRGAEHSSRWVSGRGAALVASSLLDGGAEGPVRLSTPLDGAYGIEGVPLSVPVTPTARGVGEMRERELSPGEREGLREAAGAVRRGT